MAIRTCPSDEALLAVLLDEAAAEDREHVGGCADCQGRLKRLASELTTVRQAAAALTGPDKPRPDATPTSIGRYLVVGALGSGGQGRVYRGLHPRLGLEVAIKWSDVEVGPGSSGRDALVAEGQVLARLSHPHLVRVLDLDVHEGRPFLVMEYVRGGDLEERLKGRSVAAWQAATWVAQLAGALQEAHAAGVTHQDVKPRNVLLDEADQVRLADFGLARLRQAQAAGEGLLGGTLAYMAPEQARKEVEKIGPASDVFGLGGVLLFLLTGRAPFEGDNPLLVRQKACEGKVHFAALEAARVPRPLASICRRALAAEPAQRYASAGAMAADLEHWLKRPRFRPFLIVAAAVALALTAGFFFFWPRSSPLPEGPQPLIEQVAPRDRGTLGSLYAVRRLGKGDRYKILCDVPRGYNVALFYVDSEGKVSREKDFVIKRGDRFDQLIFPPPGQPLLRQTGPPGTEMFLVCASRFSLPADEVEALLTKEGRWPIIKGPAFLSLGPDKVRSPEMIKSPEMERTFERASPPTDFSRAWDRLEELRQKLRERCEFFAGVVYGYDG